MNENIVGSSNQQECNWSDHSDYGDYPDYRDHLDYQDYYDYRDHQDWHDYQDYDDYEDHHDWDDHSDNIYLPRRRYHKDTLLASPCLHMKKTVYQRVDRSFSSADDTEGQPQRPYSLLGNDHPLNSVYMVLDIVTQACNMHCSYCHESAVERKSGIRQESYEKTVAWIISNVKRKGNHRKLKWIFHGGEPLLIGHAMLRERVKYINRIAKQYRVIVGFGIQTNGTLLNEKWNEWLIRNRIRVGCSLDGPPDVNNVWRSHGENIEEKVKAYCGDGGKLGILCVLNSTNVHKVRELVPYFLSLGADSIRFNPCRHVGRTTGTIVASIRDLTEAKRELLSMILEEDKWEIDADLMSVARRYVVQKKHQQEHYGICSQRPCGAGKRLIAITPEGRILACGRALNLPNNVGIVAQPGERPDKELWQNRIYTFLNPQRERQDCIDCTARIVCTGGCPSFLWRNPQIREAICGYWKGIMSLFEGTYSSLS